MKQKIIVIKYKTPLFDNPLNEVMNNLLENFLATKYAMVEEVLYKDKNGTKVGCYNPVDNRRIVTYLESEEIVKKFDTEDNAIQYIENQALLEKEKAGILFIELKKHIDKFFENIEKNEMVYKQA